MVCCTSLQRAPLIIIRWHTQSVLEQLIVALQYFIHTTLLFLFLDISQHPHIASKAVEKYNLYTFSGPTTATRGGARSDFFFPQK